MESLAEKRKTKKRKEKGTRQIIIVDSIYVKHMIAILITLNRKTFLNRWNSIHAHHEF